MRLSVLNLIMKFKIKADAVFEAKDLEDAFKLWKEHFEALERGEDTKVFFTGEIKIEGIDETKT